MRTGRQAGLIAWRAQSPIARAPRVRRARSNWRRFQRLRPACSRRCSVGMTLTGAPSQRSAAAAAIGAAVQRVCGGAGCGTRARARPPSRRTVATPSMLAQVMTAPSTRADTRRRRVEVAGRRVVGPGHRHDPVDEDAGLLQRRELVLEPGLVDGGDPGRLAGDGERRDGEVDALRVIEQRLFDHADERHAQARRRRLGQGDAVPADVGLLDDGDDDRARRQQRRGGVALRVDLDAVVAGDVGVLAPTRAGGAGFLAGAGAQALAFGKLEDEGRHGVAARAGPILGTWRERSLGNQGLRGDLAAKSPYWFSLWRGLRAGLVARGDALALQDDDRAVALPLHERTLLEDDVAEAKPAAHLEEIGADHERGPDCPWAGPGRAR